MHWNLLSNYFLHRHKGTGLRPTKEDQFTYGSCSKSKHWNLTLVSYSVSGGRYHRSDSCEKILKSKQLNLTSKHSNISNFFGQRSIPPLHFQKYFQFCVVSRLI